MANRRLVREQTLKKAQMKDREEREKSWKRLRRDIDKRSTTRLAFRIGARF